MLENKDIIFFLQYLIAYLYSKIFNINHIDMIINEKNQGKLFLGDIISALDENILDKNDIKVIINCSNDLPFIVSGNKYEIYRCGIDDISLNINKQIKKYKEIINTYLTLINASLKEKKNVLIHCRNGMQRSATMIAAYLIKYLSFEKQNAIEYLKNKRWICFKPYAIFDSLL